MDSGVVKVPDLETKRASDSETWFWRLRTSLMRL
jgi:hypothetical protein